MSTTPNTPQGHDHSHDTVREREVIVTNGDSGRGMGGTIFGVAAAIVLLVLAYVLITSLSGGESGDAGLDVPSEMDVNIDGGGEG